jgi:two-component sensor histidine kinase
MLDRLLNLNSAAHACLLAQAIVDTVREPLLVLDKDLRVVVPSRSFLSTFQVDVDRVVGIKIYDLDDGVWDDPELRLLLEKIIPEHETMDGFEVERDFPRIGRRFMLLNARKVHFAEGDHTTILLGIEDVSERRRTDRALRDLLAEKDMLLSEMSHRIANSLQIIASILLMKARIVDSAETRGHLQDAHRRVLSVAAVQQHLQPTTHGEGVAVWSYLTKLCETLGASMIGENRPIKLEVVSLSGTATSSHAVSLGLIVTELVINSLKHAFPEEHPAGKIIVGYEVKDSDWKLSVSDNGVGMPDQKPGTKSAGLGTSLIKALAHQLDADVEVVSSDTGTTVSITHATFVSRLPTAA